MRKTVKSTGLDKNLSHMTPATHLAFSLIHPSVCFLTPLWIEGNISDDHSCLRDPDPDESKLWLQGMGSDNKSCFFKNLLSLRILKSEFPNHLLSATQCTHTLQTDI